MDAEDEAPSASALRLWAPAPNPSRGTATLRLAAAWPRDTRAVLLDIRGREVAVLLEGGLRGEVAAPVHLRALAADLYLVRASAGDAVREMRWRPRR